MEKVGCSYSKPDERRMNITVLEKLKTVKNSGIEVRHNRIDIIDSGIWANRMVEYWETFTYVQQWRVYERLIVVVRTLEGRKIPTEEWFIENKRKYYNSMSVKAGSELVDEPPQINKPTENRPSETKTTENTNQTKLF